MQYVFGSASKKFLCNAENPTSTNGNDKELVEGLDVLVNQDNWKFARLTSSPLQVERGVNDLPQSLSFATSAELVRYLADDEEQDYGWLQSRVQERLAGDPAARNWRKARTLLKHLTHFPRYRKNEFDLYHRAARNCARKNASREEMEMVEGLDAEIDESRNVLEVNQVLFHGRADCEITSLSPYPTYVSTSLDPVVACNSALRRGGIDRVCGQPTVYILTLGCHLPSLWGHVGRSHEYELLLPRLLTTILTDKYYGRNLRVVEARITHGLRHPRNINLRQ